MIQSITMNAYAKINLTLDVLSKREDGYHEIKTIMQTVSLHDAVTVSKGKNGITVWTSRPYIPRDGRNIAYKAAAVFFEAAGIKDGAAHISIKKRIPVAAGLAGGSADGAAVLRALNLMYNQPFTNDKLLAIGAKVGADVPFCMTGGTVLCEGIGEKVTRLCDMPDCVILLAMPHFSVSTADIYSKLDRAAIYERPDTCGMVHCIESGDVKGIAHRVFNVMEAVVSAEHEIISGIKKAMIESGADGACMSGSGPSVFGIFADKNNANKAAKHIKNIAHEVFVCEPVHFS